MNIRAGIVGASGYAGGELVRLLLGHPAVELVVATGHSTVGQRLDRVHPALRGRTELSFAAADSPLLSDLDAVFVALPHGEAMAVVPSLLAGGKTRVIDLGGDFRLADAATYRRYYGAEHAAPELLSGGAVYGLTELVGPALDEARLVANPGCYPTATTLGLAPLLKAGLIEPTGIAVSALSGTSGAGRSTKADLSFSELDGNVRAYKVGQHQHTPEIALALQRFGGSDKVTLSFVPHLIPAARGIHATSFVRPTAGATVEAAHEALTETYRGCPFVQVLGPDQVPEMAAVVGTNRCDLTVRHDAHTGHFVVLSVIDNLIKGAAGQAVQNLNRMFGLTETTGLL